MFPEVAQQVDHRRGHDQIARAQRQAAECSHLLLELAGVRRLDGQVPRVVRARGHLVDEQPPLGREEELDAEHANGAQRLGHRQGHRASVLGDDRPHGRRHDRRVQDMPLVMVQADRIGHRAAILSPGHDDRDLGGELDPALGHAGNLAQTGPGRRERRLRGRPAPAPCRRSRSWPS